MHITMVLKKLSASFPTILSLLKKKSSDVFAFSCKLYKTFPTPSNQTALKINLHKTREKSFQRKDSFLFCSSGIINLKAKKQLSYSYDHSYETKLIISAKKICFDHFTTGVFVFPHCKRNSYFVYWIFIFDHFEYWWIFNSSTYLKFLCWQKS